MTDFQAVRREAQRKGPIREGSTVPIPVLPTAEYEVTRVVCLPVLGKDNKKIVGKYMLHPAVLTVVAWSSAEASSRADILQANYRDNAWGQGSTPWGGEGKINWVEVSLPPFTKPLQLR